MVFHGPIAIGIRAGEFDGSITRSTGLCGDHLKFGLACVVVRDVAKLIDELFLGVLSVLIGHPDAQGGAFLIGLVTEG